MINNARMLRTFLELVQIKAESGREEAVAQHLSPRLHRLGLSVKKNGEDSSGNVIATLSPTPGRSGWIAIAAHMDTVPLENPVKPVLRDGAIYSSGNTILGADDRVGIASILEALETVIEKRLPHPGIEVIFTVSEEEGLVGAKRLTSEDLQASMAFIVDSSSDPGHIVVQAPSHVNLSWIVAGKAAHAGIAPEKGVNAIVAAAEGIAAMNIGRIDHETTSNVGIIRGGTATNIVCDSVYVEGEARSFCEKKLEDLVKSMVDAMEARVAKRGASVQTKVQKSYTGFSLKETSPVVQWAISAVRRSGLLPVLISTGGGSDANIFNEKGLPAVNLGTGAQNVHTTKEYISERDLYTIGDIIVAIMTGA